MECKTCASKEGIMKQIKEVVPVNDKIVSEMKKLDSYNHEEAQKII